MPTSSDSRLQEADLLTRAVENVFRRLIRLLVGRITLVKLQEMIRFIYVEETEKKLRAERPGRNVALTRLALDGFAPDGRPAFVPVLAYAAGAAAMWVAGRRASRRG